MKAERRLAGAGIALHEHHGNTIARPDASIVCEVEVVDRILTVRIFDEGVGFKLPEPMMVSLGRAVVVTYNRGVRIRSGFR